MTTSGRPAAVQKLRTGIEGFDLISSGGLPLGRATLLSGTSGSAKTVFAVQFLADGIIKAGQHGVFVTFEESVPDIAMEDNAAENSRLLSSRARCAPSLAFSGMLKKRSAALFCVITRCCGSVRMTGSAMLASTVSICAMTTSMSRMRL